MKRSKMIIGIIVAAVLSFVVIAFYKAKQLQVIELNHTVSIAASREKVYEMLSQLKQYPQWSPFLAQDPSQKYWVEGRDGEIGASYHWEGNGGKDLGRQEIVKLVPGSFVGIQCDIRKPFEARPTFDYTVSSRGGTTEVLQKFRLESTLANAFFLWIFGVKKEMSTTNQQGLELLRKAAQK